MTEKQLKILRNYKFPKYYEWFYKFWTKYLSLFVLCMFVVIGIFMIIHNETKWEMFDFIKSLIFIVFGCGIWALTAYLTKTIHLRLYLKKSKMTLSEWNSLTKGLSIDDIKML
jgi:hypothetical protein